MFKRSGILVAIVLFLITSLLFFLVVNRPANAPKIEIENPKEKQNPINLETDDTNIDKQVICTMEAQECPDGSFVARTGPNCEFTKCPEVVAGQETGWKTYKNYGLEFEISFLEKYKLLDDNDNKYGWKNSVALIYGGGQSYDLVISSWDSEQEYKNEYKNAEDRLTVFKVNERYIVLFNQNKDAEIEKTISTFKTL